MTRSAVASSAVDPDWKAYPSLFHSDRAKQKEAMNQYLADNVRTDWEFPWPQVAAHRKTARSSQGSGQEPNKTPSQSPSQEPDQIQDQDETGDSKPPEAEPGGLHQVPILGAEPQPQPTSDVGVEVVESGYEVDDDADSVSCYSSVSESETKSRFCYRDEWSSELSDEDATELRFDTPETVGIAIRAEALAKKAQRRRALRKEARWNEGLACFEARRNAWTGARTVRVRPSPPPRPGKRMFFRGSISAASNPASPGPSATNSEAPSPAALQKSDSSDSAELGRSRTKESLPSASSGHVPAPMEAIKVILPVPRPFLPPTSHMRASITRLTYLPIYDKVVIQGLTPSCPINLGDILRSCVAGWQRDNEWPPKSTVPNASAARTQASQGTAPTRQRRRSFMQLMVGRSSHEPAEGPKNDGWIRVMSRKAPHGNGDGPGDNTVAR